MAVDPRRNHYNPDVRVLTKLVTGSTELDRRAQYRARYWCKTFIKGLITKIEMTDKLHPETVVSNLSRLQHQAGWIVVLYGDSW